VIAIFGHNVIYSMSDMDDDALCARLSPALNAAGYALLPRTRPLRQRDTIATIPSAQAINLSPQLADSKAYDAAPEPAVEPEAKVEAQPEAHDPSSFSL
jgi:hypothetical protein